MNIPEPWIFSVVYIANTSTGKSGTGFLVSRKVDKDQAMVFLISNKHVLEPKQLSGKSGEDKEAKATITINKLEGEEIKILTIEVILRDKTGKEYIHGNPDKEIDVAAMEFTSYISENRVLKPGLKIGFIQEESFATKERLKEDFVTIGDRVIVLGYPLNLVEGGHSIPIARDGVIASDPIYNFRNMPAILIDSTMVRGSSGSPVFLPILPYKWTSASQVNTFAVTQAKLIGIISQLIPDWSMEIKKTIAFGMEPEVVSVIDVANLGILFKVETITKTIDEFGYFIWQPPKEEQKQEEKK